MHGLIQQRIEDSGPFSPGYAPKIVLHTTEGAHYPGPSLYHGTNPTFTCDVKRRRTYQHCDIHRAALALENHPGGVETNHARAVQIEIVGFTAVATARHYGAEHMAVEKFTHEDYAYLKSLLEHIHKEGHPAHLAHANPWGQRRFSEHHWRDFNGVCGHMHVPENSHVDPGTHIHIDQLVPPK
jgi:hypothetical protein